MLFRNLLTNNNLENFNESDMAIKTEWWIKDNHFFLALIGNFHSVSIFTK